MNLILESDKVTDYLAETEEVDYSHAGIREKAEELSCRSSNEVAFVQAVFEFVRDRISHSWDIQSTRVTSTASDVLRFQEGICYAKSLLLCALLRSKGIPAGFCYQRLTLGETPETGYALHALNAVFLSSLNRWVRLDARGNKEGVNAQFSLGEEQLAFPIRPPFGEIDYPTIYVSPNSRTLAVLKQFTNGLEMYQNHLPTALE
ncbi:transglutaminase family protein [Paenibacillus aurantius]|uniref:Transglutaminase family protein n=1 Tax=Paenibacillus aurantius TaxID=2918900 RepID=A0AA96LLM7_9BACL|nr:transglutaminase family protein [Paenibacillus aurantius]WNQ14330.1 transglutaminase family protein [Paenibacillus aurantius]